MNSNSSYSLETLNFGQNRRFLGPCDLEMWRMSLKKGHIFYATSSSVHYCIAICKFKLELQSENAKFESKSSIFFFAFLVQNLVILAWTSDELSCGPARDWYTHTARYMDTQTEAMTLPKGHKWPQVKSRTYQKWTDHMRSCFVLWFCQDDVRTWKMCRITTLLVLNEIKPLVTSEFPS